MQDPKKAAFFMKWKYSCMVPDPLEQMSCNVCPKSAQRSTIHDIRKVFKARRRKDYQVEMMTPSMEPQAWSPKHGGDNTSRA
jgi:hypothetical protein